MITKTEYLGNKYLLQQEKTAFLASSIISTETVLSIIPSIYSLIIRMIMRPYFPHFL